MAYLAAEKSWMIFEVFSGVAFAPAFHNWYAAKTSWGFKTKDFARIAFNLCVRTAPFNSCRAFSC
jgi:hypothetical protein